MIRIAKGKIVNNKDGIKVVDLVPNPLFLTQVEGFPLLWGLQILSPPELLDV
jgi:hypothetical protein